MGSASKHYLKGIYSRFSYLGTWLPNLALRLGDVGVQENDQFKQMTTLKDLGIAFRMRGGRNKVDFTYTSESGVALKTKLAGDVALGTALPLGEAGVSMHFSNEGAFFFQATGCTIEEVEDKAMVGQLVIKLLEQRRWDSRWAVVDTIVRAQSATIIVSNSANSTLDLTAKTPLALTHLANLDTGLSVSSQTGDIIRFLAATGLTPLFRLSRVKQSLLSRFFGPKVITFGGPSTSVPVRGEELFEAVTPE